MKSKQTYQKGIWSEYLAALFLTLRGYRILKLRFKTKSGEIDLIARKGKALVFVEVKYRKNFLDALEAITPKTQRRIIKAAQYFISSYRPSVDECRFDVVAISSIFHLKHIKNAFHEGGVS